MNSFHWLLLLSVWTTACGLGQALPIETLDDSDVFTERGAPPAQPKPSVPPVGNPNPTCQAHERCVGCRLTSFFSDKPFCAAPCKVTQDCLAGTICVHF